MKTTGSRGAITHPLLCWDKTSLVYIPMCPQALSRRLPAARPAQITLLLSLNLSRAVLRSRSRLGNPAACSAGLKPLRSFLCLSLIGNAASHSCRLQVGSEGPKTPACHQSVDDLPPARPSWVSLCRHISTVTATTILRICASRHVITLGCKELGYRPT